MCPLGAWIQHFLEDPRKDQVAVETLSPPDLDKMAGVIADAVDAEGAWEGPRGAGGEPGEPADSSEAALGEEDGAHGGGGAQGERLSLALTLRGTGRPRPQSSTEQPCWKTACPLGETDSSAEVQSQKQPDAGKCFCLDRVLVSKSIVRLIQ